MMRVAMLCLLLVGGAMMTPAAAVDLARLYVGGGITDGTVSRTNGDDKSLSTVSVNMGLELVNFLGVEFQLGAASDQTDSLLSEPLVQYQAALVRLGMQPGKVGVFLLGGQARMDIDTRFNNSSSGLVYGAGINLFGSRTTAVNFHFLDFDDGAFRTATLGFQYYIGGKR